MAGQTDTDERPNTDAYSSDAIKAALRQFGLRPSQGFVEAISQALESYVDNRFGQSADPDAARPRNARQVLQTLTNAERYIRTDPEIVAALRLQYGPAARFRPGRPSSLDNDLGAIGRLKLTLKRVAVKSRPLGRPPKAAADLDLISELRDLVETHTALRITYSDKRAPQNGRAVIRALARLVAPTLDVDLTCNRLISAERKRLKQKKK